jgi:type IV fimbrial biogenesis protein FimT
VRPVRPAGSAGFTFVEAAVVLAILGILLAVGVPSMSNWMLARKAGSAAGFYKDGFVLARSQAMAHNSASRMVLIDNANGQMDWRVDICFPTGDTPCSDVSGSWSTTAAPAGGDPDQQQGFRSVLRSADALPASNALVTSIDPIGADAVYFTPLGWVDGRVAPRVNGILLDPARSRSGAFAPMEVALTLGGVAAICNPGSSAPSAKRCPP